MAEQPGTAEVPLTAEEVVNRLESQIIARELPPGRRLPSERLLAGQFGVSRPVVREGLRRLQERGLITVHPGRGSFVRELRPTRGMASVEQLLRRGEVTARDLVVARRMLEGETAALAAERRTDEDVARMRDLLEAFDASPDVALTADLDLAFHETIAMAARNPVIQIMFGAIRNLTRAMVLRSLTDRAARRVGAPLHHDILEAIADRDPARARAAMTTHVTLAEEHYGGDIDLPLASVLLQRSDGAAEHADLLREASAFLSSS